MDARKEQVNQIKYNIMDIFSIFGQSGNYVDLSKIGLVLIGIVVLILVAILVGFGILLYLKRVKERVMQRKSLGLCYFEVKVPKDNSVEIKAAEQMFTGLIGVSRKLKRLQKYTKARVFVSFEIVSFKDKIKFFVVCPNNIASLVDRQINGTYPSAEISKVKEYNLFPENAYVSYTALRLEQDSRVPIQTYEELPVDSIATITDAMSKLGDGEAAVFQLIVTPAGSNWRNSAKKYVEKMKDPGDGEEKKKPKVDSEELSLIEKKVQKAGFYTDVRIVVVSSDEFSAKTHLSNMLSSFDHFAKEGGNRFKKIKGKKLKNIAKDFIYRLPRETMILNTAELATLFHFPNKNIETPFVQWLLSKKYPAPDFVTNGFKNDYMYVGKNKHRGSQKEIFIKPKDRLRHLYVIGQTGAGKSGFMGGLMVRDIKMGHGCAFIDPHGSDVEKILQQIPPERVEDVVFFDPSDLERPVGLNMLEFNNDAQRTLVTNEMINIFNTLYDLKKTGGPMFEQYFRYGIMLMTEDVESGSTIMDFPRLFADEGYRNYKLDKCQNQDIKDFWQKQAIKAGGEASLKNITPYVVSKFASFLTNAYVKPIVSQQKSTINFRQIMDEGKILLVKLAKGKIGDFNSNLLGMILIGKLLVAALEREDIPEDQRVPFYLYIDEFQNFLTDGINVILSEARKYKLSLTMGHQFIGQLTRSGGDNKIRDSIFGNVGNKAIFRVGVEDAKFLEKEVEGFFEHDDMLNMENGNFVFKMLVDGRPATPFTCRSWHGESPYDMMGEPNRELADVIRQITRLKYGRDRNVVENELKLRRSFVKEKKKKSNVGGFGGGGMGGFAPKI